MKEWFPYFWLNNMRIFQDLSRTILLKISKFLILFNLKILQNLKILKSQRRNVAFSTNVGAGPIPDLVLAIFFLEVPLIVLIVQELY